MKTKRLYYAVLFQNLGMYPQTVVPSGDNLHTTLTNGMDVENSGVTFTGKHYTANKDATAWNPDDNDPNYSQELYPVYEYQGKRYVRVTPYSYIGENSENIYNDGSEIGQVSEEAGNVDTWRWFKVEPIKWIVLNYDWLPKNTIKNYNGIYSYELAEGLEPHKTLELCAAEILIAGIPFNNINTPIWSESIIYQYLNNVFYNEAFPMTDIPDSAIYNNTAAGENTNVTGLNSNYLSDASGENKTHQYVYLLSRYEMFSSESPYVKNGIFASGTGTTSTRQARGTDYARAHYSYIYANTNTLYWTRTAIEGNRVSMVYNDGSAINTLNITVASYSTRPALTIVCFHQWTAYGLLF